jgi:aspartyl/asparaginyl beta-hydroxylase (cupin superfamily)
MASAPLTQDSAIAAMRAAAAALQDGDGVGARAHLAPLLAADLDHPQLWMLLGSACRLTGDHAALEHAADALLLADPAQARAMAWKGECRLAVGDRRGAAAWFRSATRAIAAIAAPPASLVTLAEEVAAHVTALDAGFTAAIDEGLAARGIDMTAASPAFARSLAIMRGQDSAALELQRPASYYYPGLPQRRFYEREEFAWAAAVEAATPAIRAELTTALADPALFQPYLTHQANRPAQRNALDNDPAWSALHLIENGTVRANLAPRFPATLAAMEHVPLCRISVRSPTVMFSLLQPGAKIDPHHGEINARLICHLPLIVPGAGALEVGGEARSWEEGKLIIFDDSIEHAAWNHADADRVVLIFDVWRPEIGDADQRAIAALFETVDNYA